MSKLFLIIGLCGFILTACSQKCDCTEKVKEKRIYSMHELESDKELQWKVWQEENCKNLSDLQYMDNKNCTNIGKLINIGEASRKIYEDRDK